MLHLQVFLSSFQENFSLSRPHQTSNCIGVKRVVIRFICVISLIFNFYSIYSQTRGDFVWQLGFRSTPQIHTSPRSLLMDFKAAKVVVDTLYREISMGHFNTSISDYMGNLLLYSNGCQIRDGNHNYVENSDNLNPGSLNDEWCISNNIGYPIPEGGLFLPFLNDTIIILLHQRKIVINQPITVFVDGLFYTSLIKNGQSYSIIEKSISLIQDSLSDGRLEAVRTFDENIWWVLQGIRNSNSYYTVKLNAGLIDTIFIQSIGDTTIKSGEASGQSVFSPDGSKYARYSSADDLYLFDFDLESGLLSNFRKIHVSDSGSNGGLAFSSNSRFLYACTQLDMYQFDSWESDIESTKFHLGHYDGHVDPFPTNFYHMQLAPDCKIYVASTNGVSTMHVINTPNEKGLKSDFKQHDLQLPVSNSITQPNFPVFGLDNNWFCDTTMTHNEEIEVYDKLINIFPNPVNDEVIILIPEDNFQLFIKPKIHITNILGQIVSSFPLVESHQQLNLTFLPSGVYIMMLESKGRAVGSKKIFKW